MKDNCSNWLTIAITAIVGILLIVWHNRFDVLQWIIIAMGFVVLAPSAYSLTTSLFAKSKKKPDGSVAISTVIAALAGVALGLWMIIQPSFFVGLLAYLFAAILILYGILQLIVVGYWSRPFVLPAWFYIIPSIMIVAGIVILFTTVRTMNSIVVLLTGIMLLSSAINWALEYTVTHPARRQDNAA